MMVAPGRFAIAMKLSIAQYGLLAVATIGLATMTVCEADVLPFQVAQPLVIPDVGASTNVVSTFTGPAMSSVDLISVTMFHHWLGDLTVTVLTPTGAQFVLFQNVGDPPDGSPAALGLALVPADPSSDFQPLGAAPYRFAVTGTDFTAAAQSAIDNQTFVVPTNTTYAAQTWLSGPFPAGVWQLVVVDRADMDGGEVDAAEIDYTSGSTPPTPTVTLNWAAPANIVYGTPLDSNPLNATATANGSPVPGVFTYSPPAGSVLPAGNQMLSVTFTPQDLRTFSPTTTSVPIQVEAAPLMVSADNHTKSYGSSVPVLTTTFSGFVNGDTAASLTQPVVLTTTATAASPVGTYPITASGGASPNYNLMLSNGRLDITPAPLVIAADNKTMTYGMTLPTFTATFSGFVNGDTPASLLQPVIFSTTATASSPAGTYPITITAVAGPNYTLVVNNGVLTITKATLTLTVTPDNKTKVYGAPLPPLTATYTGFINGDTVASLTQPVVLSTPATAASPVGSYPITASGGASPNYNLVLSSGTLTITPAPLVITADNKTVLYGMPLPSFSATFSGFANGDTPASLNQPVTFATTATASSPAGTYPITITAAAGPNYTLVLNNGVLTITKATLNVTVTPDNKTKVYGAPLPPLTATYTGFINGDTAASLTQPVVLSTPATAASPVGSYPITASGGASPNYNLVLSSGTLTITPAPLVIAAENKTITYGMALPTFTATYSGFVNGDTPASLSQPVTFATTAIASSPAGTYPITIAAVAGPNYTLILNNGLLTISKATLTLSVTPDNKTKVYGAPLPPLTATYTGFINGDTVASLTQPVVLSTPATAASPVGAYPITASGGASPNYNLVLNGGTLTITPAPLVITADDKTVLYGTALPTFTATYTGFVNGDTPASLTQPVTFTTTATAGSDAGAYPITIAAAAAPNYTLVLNNGLLTISKATLTVTVTPDNKTKIYGAPLPPLTATYSGFVNGDTATNLMQPVVLSTSATAASPTGTYPITARGGFSPNYNLLFNTGTLTITPAPLVVTADDKIVTYGAALPTFTASYSGFVNGDTAASLTQPVTFATTAIASSPTGTYPITITSGGSPNYSLSFKSGNLLIARAVLTITADDKTKVYGDALPTFTASYKGLVNGDTPASLTAPIVFYTQADAHTSAGVYQIRVSGGDSSNYILVLNNAALTITPAPLTVTANNVSKAYGAPLPTFTASYNGLVNGDTPAVLSQPPVFATVANANTPIGSYPITISGAASANYAVTFNPGMLQVTPAPLVVTAQNKSKVYGAALPQLSYSIKGFVNGDTEASLTQPVTLATSAAASSAVGDYPISVTAGANPNYSLVINNGLLTVTKATLIVAADAKTKVYGAPLPALTATYDGFTNGDTAASLTQPVMLSTTATVASLVGTYPITASGGAIPNYNLVLNSGALTVNPAPLAITADDKTMPYGAPLPTLTATYNGLVNGDTPATLIQPVAFATTATSKSSAGTYPITITAAAGPNYTLVLNNGVLTITKAMLNVTVTPDNKTKVYGAPLPPLTATYSGFVNGDTPASLTQPVLLSTTATAASPVGAYPITATGSGNANYSLAFNTGTLTITPAPLVVIADDKIKTYGAALPVFTATYNGLVNGDTLTKLAQPVTFATTATASSATGNYPISITGGSDPNYSLTFNSGTLVVARAVLTIAAENKTKVYGGPLPTLTAKYKGFVNGDTPASLTVPITFYTSVDARTPVGAYQIRITGGGSTNYNLVLNNGVLTITPALLTITADNMTTLYGSPLPNFTATYSGFIDGDTAAVLSQAPAFTTSATTNSPAGSYPIVVSSAAAANYTIDFVSGTLTVVDLDPPPRCDVNASNLPRDGTLHVGVTAAAGRKMQLEWSDDLQHWHAMEAKSSSTGQIGFDVTGLNGVPVRFFRAVSVSD
jgi:hypothetical protein